MQLPKTHPKYPPTPQLGPFIESMNSCPKTGLHNPLKNVDRYLMLGHVSRKAGEVRKIPPPPTSTYPPPTNPPTPTPRSSSPPKATNTSPRPS